MTDHHSGQQTGTATTSGTAPRKKRLTPLDVASGATKHEVERIAASPVAHYMHDSHGLHYVGVNVDRKTGAATQAAPQWISSDVELFGCGVDLHGSHYRMLRFKTATGGEPVELALPRELIDSNEGIRLLRKRGVRIASSPWSKIRFSDYLDSDAEGSLKLHTITDKSGWHNNAYMLPGGGVIGEPGTPLFYNGEPHLTDTYRPSNKSRDLPHGDPAGWRDEVARLARGNSRFMLTIGAAFAAPLLHLLGMESGGIHIFGSTTDGKTTAALIGGSVWGHPEKQKLSWNSTTYALSNEASTRNDGLMILDEVGQSDPGTVAQAAYNLFNGRGKLQGTKDAGNRQTKSWRVMLISTGEHPVDVFVSDGGKRFNGGQEVRLPSIPSDAGRFMGAVEQLHEHPSAVDFSGAILKAASTHYGSAGRAFLAHIQRIPGDELRKRLDGCINEWCASLDQATGAAKRVARRFALMGAALELATEFGLTGWDAGEGNAATHRCFDEWLRRNGQTKHEDARIIEQAEAFFAAYGLARFHRIRPNGALDPCYAPSAAGYLKLSTDESAYLVYPHVFEKEVAKGFDKATVVSVLKAAGMLKTPEDGRPCKGHRVPQDVSNPKTKPMRLYEFASATRAASDNAQSDPDDLPPGTTQQPEPAAPSCDQTHNQPADNQGGKDAQLPATQIGSTATGGSPARREPCDKGGGSLGPMADYREGPPVDPSRENSSQQAGSDPGGHPTGSESHHCAGILPAAPARRRKA